MVGLHPDFELWLKSQSVKQGPVFPNMIGRVSSGRSGLSAEFASIMRKAGIESESIRQKSGKGRTVRSESFHSLGTAPRRWCSRAR